MKLYDAEREIKALKEYEERRRRNTNDSLFVRLDFGDNIYKILPGRGKHSSLPFVEVRRHFAVSDGRRLFITCPKVFNKSCYICEKAHSLWTKGKKKKARKLFPRSRYYFNVVPVVYKDGKYVLKKRAKVLAIPNSVFDSIFELLLDRDIRLTDPAGKNLVVIKKKKVGEKNIDVRYSVRVKTVPELKPLKKKVLKDMVDLEKLLTPIEKGEDKRFYKKFCVKVKPKCYGEYSSADRECKLCNYKDSCKESKK